MMNRYTNIAECLMLLVVWIGVFCIVTTTAAGKPAFIVNPRSMNAINNKTVMLTCAANNTDSITYRINGSAASVTSVREKGFDQLQLEFPGQGLVRRNLSFLAKSEYNNTKILCEADGNGVQFDVYSETANIMVQGRSSEVDDLHVSGYKSSSDSESDSDSDSESTCDDSDILCIAGISLGLGILLVTIVIVMIVLIVKIAK